jgi:uncharacterized protein with beta-barrel porin domain
LNATDANTITYSISGGDSAHFNVNSSTGVVTFKVAPDFENPTDSDTNNTYSFTATATDTFSNSSQQNPVVVTVVDVVESATFTIDAIADVSVNEGVAYTSVTPNLSGDTPIGSVTYALSGTDAADFTINSSTGVVSMIARDFENPADSDTNNTYALTITATDSDGNSDTEDWVVTVVDVVESATNPTMTITALEVNDGAVSAHSSLSLTFTLSETATDFAVGDIVVTNGTLSEFTGSGKVYTATFTPTEDGPTTINIAADTFTDPANNDNTAADEFNWTHYSLITDPTLKKDVVGSVQAWSDIASRWGYRNIYAIHQRLTWLERNKYSTKTSHQGIKVHFKNKVIDKIMNATPKSKESALDNAQSNAVASLVGGQDCPRDDDHLTDDPLKDNTLCDEVHPGDTEGTLVSVKNIVTSEVQNVIINEAERLREDVIGTLNPSFDPVIDDWSVWTSGEISVGKSKDTSVASKQDTNHQSIHLGFDRPLEDGGGIVGVALGIGTDKIDIGSDITNVKADNYSVSVYGEFHQDNDTTLEAVLGLGRLKFDTIRKDGPDTLTGNRDADQIFASVTLKGDNIGIETLRNLNIDTGALKQKDFESDYWGISPYFKVDMSYTKFEQFSESGAVTALTFKEQNMYNTRVAIGVDIDYLFKEDDKTIKPFVELEYGIDMSKTSDVSMHYIVQGEGTNYNLQLNNTSDRDWKFGLGVELDTEDDLSAVVGYRRQNGLGSNPRSSDSIYFDLEWKFSFELQPDKEKELMKDNIPNINDLVC